MTKEYYEKNKALLREKQKEYERSNGKKLRERKKEYIENYRQENKEYYGGYYKEYREENKTKLNEKQNARKLKDPLFKLKTNMSSKISNCLTKNRYVKKSRTSEILGCSIEEFKLYLESKFEPWMNWNNYGKYNGTLNYGFDIDHIIPVSSAKTEEDVLRLNHYTNLQPLCSYVNRYVKRGIIDWKE